MALNKENIKRWYRHGIWDREQVGEAVQCGELSEAEYTEIVGEAYESANFAKTILTEQEEISIDTALNVEYMVCLMEESLGLE